MKAESFRLRKLAAAVLGALAALPATAMGGALTLQSNYLYIGANDYGTLGYYRNTSPGIQHDPTGSRTFAATKDYFTPGTPFEGFTLYDGGGVVVNNNNADLGGSALAPTNSRPGALAGTVTDKSGVSFLGTTADYRAFWSDNGGNAKVSVTNDVTFSATDQAIKITTTITAKQNLTGLKFLRNIDPDQDSPSSIPGGSSATYNSRGATDVAATDIVCGKGWIRELRICMYTRDSVTHNTGVSSGWSRDPSFYLAGNANGNGDYTIGLAYDIGALANGESVTLVYYYLFAEDLSVLATLISNAGGVNPQFVATATQQGLGPLAQLIADNAATLSTLITDLDTLDATDLAIALKKIFPSEHSAASRTAMSSTAAVSSLLFDKAGTFLGDFSRVGSFSYRQDTPENRLAPITSEQSFRDLAYQLAANPLDFRPRHENVFTANSLAATPYKRFTPGAVGGWVQGFYDHGKGDKSGGNLGYESDTYGVIIAVEQARSQDTLIGAMISYQEGTAELNESGGDTDFGTTQAGVYMQKLIGDTKLTGSFAVGKTQYESKRNISAGMTSATAEASFDGTLYSATIGASRLFKGEVWYVEPFVQFAYTYNKTDSYQETGAGALNLAVDSNVTEHVALRFGSSFKHDIDFGSYSGYVKFKPHITFQDDLRETQSTVAFTSGTGTVLVAGREIDPVTGGIGFESMVDLSKASRLRGGIDYSGGADYRSTQLYLRYEKRY